jgi:FdrA protein
MTRCLVRWDTYRDSVDLMRVATLVEKLPGVSRAALMMATPANRELLAGAGLLDATSAAARLLDEHAAVAAPSGEGPSPRSIAEAAGELPHANLAIISIPGTYEMAEALKALKRGLHAVVSAPGAPGI